MQTTHSSSILSADTIRYLQGRQVFCNSVSPIVRMIKLYAPPVGVQSMPCFWRIRIFRILYSFCFSFHLGEDCTHFSVWECHCFPFLLQVSCRIIFHLKDQFQKFKFFNTSYITRSMQLSERLHHLLP